MQKPTFKTLNQIVEGYYHPEKGLSEVAKFIVEHEEESLFVLDYKGILYQKTSGQKYDQGYETLLLPYTEIHSNSKQDLLQLLKQKMIVYFTYTEKDQQKEDFVPFMRNQIFSFMSHLLKNIQQNKKANAVKFFLMDIEAIGYIPKLPKIMAGCRGFNMGTFLFVDDKETLLYGYDKEQVDKMYNNSLVISKVYK
ncbi:MULTISPECIES: type IV secretory system conjugative DNA transfer family protein [Bacillus]|uniref:type IV secretory system conjugative DNA transfer family protein n=1 Tax=Bacillus TaxID=1386 RepID=UPI00295F8389|nr:type IV secretory system conjugative DNA transfer family protein [Bacillus cereus]HEF1866598.1 type IV secretory system conjugative DNA transfer family protein [Bacillus cereus]HEF1877794.1 type IV secretory system conjugative DNA transfer family protein [Bacillus cereus]HEF1883829.1 type IV secretory system conjugative DNA transfer family protein [Bacillus cereus]